MSASEGDAEKVEGSEPTRSAAAPSAFRSALAGILARGPSDGQTLGFVLSLRCLYLLAHGWDGGWMNWGYLASARRLALGGSVSGDEPPLTPATLLFLREAGLRPHVALALAYLAAQALFTWGTLQLARFIWPEASPRRRWCLALSLALTPLIGTVAGYRNLAVILGAGLLVAALGLAAKAASQDSVSPLRLAMIFVLAGLAACARFEALCGVVAGGLLLGALGWRGVLRGTLGPALALLLGGGLTFGAFQALHPGSGSGYGFYTFYDGLPFLMWPPVFEDGDEFGRYRASLRIFGTLAENGGSVLHALLAHPFAGFLRIALKPVDLLGALLWPGSFGPWGAFFAVFGLRALRKQPASSAPPGRSLLFAFLGPLPFLLVPPAAPHYLIFIAPALLLLQALGLDALLDRLPPARRVPAALGVIGLFVLTLPFLGKTDIMNSRAFNQTAQWVEQRCAKGCMTNYLPQSVRFQSWVELDAGVPMPAVNHRAEDLMMGTPDAAYRESFSFSGRAARARAQGYAGPILYVDSQVTTFSVFHEIFDREQGYEGRPDLQRAKVEAQFQSGPDRVTVYSYP